jgi:SNF2 family DNA or RNA helicase
VSAFVGELYDFQKSAVERMIEMRHILLAMEMGLGKTVVVIAAVEQLIEEEEIAGGFVICPASLKLQWQRMINEFTGSQANVIVVSGDALHRQDQFQDYMAGGAEYLIMNPETMVSDWEIIRKLPRDFIVCDEAQWFKNFRPKRSKKIKRLTAEYRWALTGQPIENRAEEAFSIMEWVDPKILGDFHTFDRAFMVRDHWGRVKLYRNLPTLHRILSDDMIRHTRAEVADQLPAVNEEVVPIELDVAAARLYQKVVRDLENDVAEAISTWGNFSLSGLYHGEDQGDARGRIMSKLLALRMLCDHPELIRNSAARFRGEIPGAGGSEYAEELHEAGRLDNLTKAPKLATTVELLIDILNADPANKIVIFSFFKTMLDLLATATSGLTKSVIFSGAVSQKGRDAARQDFAEDPETRLFLSSDAGGIGLDLPMANYLISYDLPWSAGAYAQRQSRIIRLSSEFPQVTLLSLQVSGSIDEYQHGLLAQKQRVADAVVDGKGISRKGRLSLDLQSLSAFLSDHEV